MHRRMDAAGAVDAQKRAHRSLENRAERGFPRRPHASSIRRRGKKSPNDGNRFTHEILDPPSVVACPVNTSHAVVHIDVH